MRQAGEQQIYDIIDQVNSRLYDNPKIEALLVSLSEYLSDYEGKKVYGYFSTKGKRLVNSIVDEIKKIQSFLICMIHGIHIKNRLLIFTAIKSWFVFPYRRIRISRR